MKRIFAMLMLTLFLVAAIAVTTSVAFADNPNLNPAGKKGVPGHTQNPNPGK